MVDLYEGDNRESLRRLIGRGVKVHSVVTDPPYGITFMGKAWDGTMIERDPEFWKLIWEILLPGGYCIAFSGSRTGHWQAVAMEQAGFIMHPMIGWVTGQGFPKAFSASKAIDAQMLYGGSHSTNIKQTNEGRPGEGRINASLPNNGIMAENRQARIVRDTAATAEAAQWDGWAYGTQSLKPAMEPIYVAQKPFSEKNGALNILKHGVGAINIDGCRVPTTDDLNGGAYAEKGGRTESPSLHAGSGMNVPGKTVGKPFVQPAGRHPANLLHDGSEEAIALFPDTGPSSGRPRHNNDFKSVAKGAEKAHTTFGHDDNGGSAARFFNALPITELDTPIHYCPKASKADRAGSKHPTVKPISLMRWLCRLVTPPGGTVLDPFGGSGTTAAAALAEGFKPILMEMEPEYIADIKRRFSVMSDVDKEYADLLGVT